MKTNRLILLLFILFPAYVLAGNRFQELYTNIHQFISQQKAEVGVAINHCRRKRYCHHREQPTLPVDERIQITSGTGCGRLL